MRADDDKRYKTLETVAGRFMGVATKRGKKLCSSIENFLNLQEKSENALNFNNNENEIWTGSN